MPKGSSDDDDRSDDDDEREGEGSDDDSDSSSAETDERCGELLAQLQQGSLTYGAALELIGLLKARADLPGVRQAREALAAAYPLPEAVWLEWIEDEARLAAGDEVDEVIELAGRAVRDGLYVGVWLRLVRLVAERHAPGLVSALDAAAEGALGGGGAAGGAGEPGEPGAGAAPEAGLREVRAALERALTAASLHLAEGDRLWSAYEAVEGAALRCAEREGGAAAAEQRARVRALWRRRLSVPLVGMECAMERYRAFEAAAALAAGEPAAAAEREVAAAERAYSAAWKAAGARRQHESKVAAARAARGAVDPWGGGGEWEAWSAYLAAEAEGGDPWRTRALFERMLSPDESAWRRVEEAAAAGEGGGGALPPCARAALWRRYLHFLVASLPSPSLRVEATARGATARGVRCCAADAHLWVARLRALEEAAAPAEEVRAAFEAALGAPLAPPPADPADPADKRPPPSGGHACDHLWLLHSYSHFQRRRLAAAAAADPAAAAAAAGSVREARDAVLAYEEAYLPGLEPAGELLRFWADAEEERGEAAQARELMERALARFGADSALWLHLAAIERRLEERAAAEGGAAGSAAPGGDAPYERCRKVFRRAVTVVHSPGHAAALHAAWLSLEATRGTLSTLRAAEERVAAHRAQLGRRGEKEAEAAEEAAAAARAAREQKRTAARKEKRAATKAGAPGALDAAAAAAPLAGKRSAGAAGLAQQGGAQPASSGGAAAGQSKKPRAALVPRAAGRGGAGGGALIPRAARPGGPPRGRSARPGLGQAAAAPAAESAPAGPDPMLSNDAFRDLMLKKEEPEG